MPEWAIILIWSLAGLVLGGVGAWLSSWMWRERIALLRDERDLARREAESLRRSRDEWEQLARDTIALNRTLRRRLGGPVPEEKN